MFGTLFRWAILIVIGYAVYLVSLVAWSYIFPFLAPFIPPQYAIIAGYVFSAIVVWFGAQSIFDILSSLFRK
jgi:hypothetical protein